MHLTVMTAQAISMPGMVENGHDKAIKNGHFTAATLERHDGGRG